MKMTRAFLGFTYRSPMICNADGDGDGDKTGGGGDGDGKGDEGKIDPAIAKYVDSKLNATINDALKSHGSRMEKRLTEQFTTTLSTSLEKAMANFKPNGDDGKADDKGGKKGGDDKGNEEARKLAAQVEEMKQKMAAKDQEAEQQKKAARQREEREALQAALREQGVPELRARAASALLYSDLGLITRNEEDQICMKVKKKIGGESFDESVPLGPAVKAWLETDEGKEFAASAPAKGSGEGGGKRPRGNGNEKPTLGDAYSFVGAKIVG